MTRQRENQQLHNRFSSLPRKRQTCKTSSNKPKRKTTGSKNRRSRFRHCPGTKGPTRFIISKSVKIGRYTNFYDEDKTPGATGKKNLVVYVEPIDETGDAIKAAGAIDVQLWDLNKKENEARLAQWQVEPNEIKNALAWRDVFERLPAEF